MYRLLPPAFLLLMLLFWQPNHAFAQQTPVRPDTIQPQRVVTPVPVGQAATGEPKKERKKLSKAKVATLMSTAVPGLGQVYNGRLWKVPVIYAVGGTLAYFAITNNTEYRCFARAADHVSSLSVDDKEPFYMVCGKRYSEQGIRANRDFYRRNRDLSIIFLGITYALNIVDANVDAHLKDFDVSEDLSMNVSPTVVPTYLGAAAPGINLTFNFRK